MLIVSQLEYDNIEGMILLSELSRRRIRSVQKLIKEGRNEVVVVMRVDPDKGEPSFRISELSRVVIRRKASSHTQATLTCRSDVCRRTR